MGLFAVAAPQIRASTEGNEHSGPLHDFWYQDAAGESDSGIRITEEGAKGLSTVYKCLNWYYKMYGTLPHKMFEHTTLHGRPAQIEATDHHLYELIHNAPAPRMSSAMWHGLIAADVKSRGNFYAAIVRDDFARILWLPRLRPDYVRPAVENKQLWYFIRGDDGREVKFYPDEILHIYGMGFDGVQGYSPIKMHANALGWNRATIRYGAQFFKNASRPSGLVELTNGVSPEKKSELLDALRASGRDAGKLVLIEGATKFHKMTLDQDEAQFILTLNLQEDDIAGIFEVKPHEIGIMRHSTNNNIEQETISSVTRGIAPFAASVEQQMNMQLLSTRPSSGIGGSTERKRYFFQSELKGLLRGDTAAQTAHLIAMFDRGIYSGNDCAGYLGNAPFEGGDVRFINRAYGPIDQAAEWSKVSQNNPSPAEPDPSKGETETKSAAAFSPIFRDAVGRALKRTVDRDKAVRGIFRAAIVGLAEYCGAAPTDIWIEDYLGSIGKRSLAWQDAEKADEIAADELRRAVEALGVNWPSSAQAHTSGTHNHVTVNVAQPPVAITNEGAVVNVPKAEPPKVDVHVEPAHVTVKPPDVIVNFETPKAKKKTQKLKRDKAGLLTEIVTEE